MIYESPLGAAAAISLYVIVATAILWPAYSYRTKQYLFCALNLVTSYLVFFSDAPDGYAGFAVIAVVTLAHWLVIRFYNRTLNENDYLFWLAFMSPFCLLVLFKAQSVLQLVGVSYMAFRMAQTAFEMRGRDDLKVSFAEYFAFLFYPPTLSSGPINPFQFYRDTADGMSITAHNWTHGLLRIAIGYIKFRYLSLIPQQLTLTALWQDSIYSLGYGDYVIAGAAYYLYLYLNFAGYSDIVIGISALLGMRVKENFDNPLMARSVMDFWGRWHISLTQFVRDAVFVPTMTTLIRLWGSAYSTAGALVAVFLIFTVLALWHGVEPGYFIFYMLHAAAFGTIYVLDQRQRRKGAKAYAAYRNSTARLWTGRLATFVFLSITCPFLEWPTWQQISLFPFM